MNMTPAEYLADPGWQYLREPDDVRMANMSKPYDSKKDVWVPDKEEGFLAGQIESTKGDEVTVVSSKGTKATIKKDQIQEMNPPKFDKAEDMSNLSFLNDASVLGNLRARYSSMLIYTYSGLFCVVINPYKRLPIYTDSVAKIYIGKRKNEMPPHLWANSDEAFRNMMQDRENQSMLITGESGAGKTENTKKVIAYFAFLGASQGPAKKPVEGDKPKVSLEDQIVQTNPILEAFGNAKTVRNNNSSRFGKFIRIHFSNTGKVAGCDIEHYLLEKSRVIRQAPGERCYHVFYFMYTNAELKKKLLLDQEIRYYHFVSQAELTVPGIDDTEEFQLMDEAFDILLFSPEEKFNCYRIMSAIMHMGEMKFKQQKDEQALPDGEDEAQKACQMYGIDHTDFLNSLCKPRVKVGTEWVTKGQNCEQVAWGIGAMSKGIYARVFNWLVVKCNETLDAKENPRAHFIGVLDIAGFEIFDMNSFEQLWINFVNEKLQQFFNHHMFVLEQEEYQREGIQWTFIDFGLDLAACIELIEKPMGVISMLDEECVVPKGSDLTLAQKLTDQHLGKHPSFEKPKPPKGKQSEAHFALKHYAGVVRYNVITWLEKNKDPLNDTTVSVMKGKCDNALVTFLWSDYETQEEAAAAAKAGGGGKKKGKSGSMMTVSMMYRESLNKLMTMLHATHPHFVRCLIPNEIKKSGVLDAALVMNQLTCNGVLEGIRICRKGFPNRMQHPDFKTRYSILAPDAAKEEDYKEAVDGITRRLVKHKDLDSEEFRVGHTKVFFKAGILAKMEDLRDAKVAACLLGVQTYIRSFVSLTDMGHKMKAYKSYGVLQNNIRSWSVLRTWDWYLIYGKIRPLLGKAAEEMAKLEKRITEVEELLKAEEEQRAKADTEQARLVEVGSHIEQELEKRRLNENHAAEEVARVKRDAEVAENAVHDLKGSVEAAEAANAEFTKMSSAIGAECADMKSQISDLEKCVEKETAEKADREEAIARLTGEKASGDEEQSRLGRDAKDLGQANNRLREEMEHAEEKATKLQRDMKNLERKMGDLEDVVQREGRHRGDTEASNKHLEDQLRSALDKIETLGEQVGEADHTAKAKERDVGIAQERLRDQASKVLRLEQQLIELGSQVTQVGRPHTRY